MPGSNAVPGTIGANEVTPTISPYGTDQLMRLTGSKRILAWIGYADRNPGGEYENTINAIYQHFTDFTFDTTTTTSASVLGALLEDKDIFLVPEQELSSDLNWRGTTFAPVLASFVQGGGTMIVLDSCYSGSKYMLDGTGLLNISPYSYSYSTAAVHDTTSPLVKGLPPAFAVMWITNAHTSSRPEDRHSIPDIRKLT